MNLGLMEMKEYITISRSPELEPHHQIQFGMISRTPLILSSNLPFHREYSQNILSPTDLAGSICREIIQKFKSISRLKLTRFQKSID